MLTRAGYEDCLRQLRELRPAFDRLHEEHRRLRADHAALQARIAPPCSGTSQPLPHLVGICPVHVGEFWTPVDPADQDPKCPACGRRVLVYAPRTALEEARA